MNPVAVLRSFCYANNPTTVPAKVLKGLTYTRTSLGFRVFTRCRRPR